MHQAFECDLSFFYTCMKPFLITSHLSVDPFVTEQSLRTYGGAQPHKHPDDQPELQPLKLPDQSPQSLLSDQVQLHSEKGNSAGQIAQTPGANQDIDNTQVRTVNFLS